MQLDDPLGLANALCYLGEVQRDLGLHAEAIAATTRSIALYRELGDPFTVAGARSYLGASLRAAGRFNEAREEFSAALAVYQEAGDDFDEAGVLLQIGMLQTQERDFAGAADSLARALEQYERWGSENGKCEVLNSLGELALAAGDLDEALQYFRQALAIAEEKEILREEARARSGTGFAYRVKGGPLRRTGNSVWPTPSMPSLNHRPPPAWPRSSRRTIRFSPRFPPSLRISLTTVDEAPSVGHD